MNRVATAGTALLVLLALTGCGGWFHQDDVAEEPLRERIGDLASVIEVDSSAEGLFSAHIWVSVSELVENDLHTIVASADELLAGREATLKIGLAHQGLLTIGFPHEFSADELVSEVHYWLALSEANKAPLGLLLHDGRFGSSRNIWDPDDNDPLDWEALRVVPDTSTAHRSYYLDDMVIYTSIPTPDIIAFRDRLAAIELGDDETVSLEYSAPGFVGVRYVSPGAGHSDPTGLASWPRVRQVVSEITALRLPQSNFVFQDTGSFASTASLYLGDCDEVLEESRDEASAELVAALASAGIEFPAGVSSGFCDDGH